RCAAAHQLSSYVPAQPGVGQRINDRTYANGEVEKALRQIVRRHGSSPAGTIRNLQLATANSGALWAIFAYTPTSSCTCRPPREQLSAVPPASGEGDADAFRRFDALGVVDAELAVDGRRDVFGADRARRHVRAAMIARPDHLPAAHAAARHHQGEDARVVVAP